MDVWETISKPENHVHLLYALVPFGLTRGYLTIPLIDVGIIECSSEALELLHT